MSRGRGANAAFFRRTESEETEGSQAIARLIARARTSGALNLSNRSLTALPDLFNLEQFPVEKFWESISLSKLDASFNLLEDFPEYDCYLELSSLSLRGNQIQNMRLDRLPLLQSLDLQSNRLTQLEDSIGSLTRLRVLSLSDNQLEYLPESIGGCLSLQELHVNNNRLTSLPESIGLLTGLKLLSITKNKVNHLPLSTSRLQKLEILDVSKNKLSSLPDMSDLLSMTLLNASENALTDLPSLPINGRLATIQIGYNRLSSISVDNLERSQHTLTELHLNNNGLLAVPPGIGVVSRLKVLDISNNNVVDLPASLGYISNLHRILLDGNPIRSIRRSLLTQSTDELKAFLRTRGPPYCEGSSKCADDTHMHVLMRARGSVVGKLDLSDLDLLEFPPDLFHSLGPEFSSRFHTIDLSMNRFKSFPTELQTFSVLKNLNLSKNLLGTTSLEALNRTSLPLLSNLDISANQLTTYHFGMILRALIRNSSYPRHPLSCLVVSMNVITDLPPELELHAALRELDLSENRITSLSTISFKHLPKLERLIVDRNRLNDIESLRDASNLITLSMENNDLRDIPPFLSLLPHLLTIRIHGNPQRIIANQIIEQGSSSILNVLRRRVIVDVPCSVTSKSLVDKRSLMQGRDDMAVDFPLFSASNQEETRLPQVYERPFEGDLYSGEDGASLYTEEYPNLEIGRIRAEIEELEAEEESFSVSEKRRASLRKELQKKRALAAKIQSTFDRNP